VAQADAVSLAESLPGTSRSFNFQLAGRIVMDMTTLIDIQATSRVLRAEQGMASGLVNASFQIGGRSAWQP
jgi:hypothetical protein